MRDLNPVKTKIKHTLNSHLIPYVQCAGMIVVNTKGLNKTQLTVVDVLLETAPDWVQLWS